MIQELITSVDLKTADFERLFSYYFYKEDNQGFVLRYDEEGYLFSAFLYKKSQEENYGLEFPFSNRNNPQPNMHIAERLYGDCFEFNYVLQKIIKKLPNFSIQKTDEVFTIQLDNLTLEDKDLNTLLLRSYLISKYGDKVEYYVDTIEYDDEKEELKLPFASYQVFPIVGSMYE